MGSRKAAFCFGKGGICAMEYNPYMALANAIIEKAVEDYRNPKHYQERTAIKNFFLSKWFSVLTEIDGKTLLNKLDEERGAEHVKSYRRNR